METNGVFLFGFFSFFLFFFFFCRFRDIHNWVYANEINDDVTLFSRSGAKAQNVFLGYNTSAKYELHCPLICRDNSSFCVLTPHCENDATSSVILFA